MSSYSIRNTLGQLNNLIASQIKSIEKNLTIIHVEQLSHCNNQRELQLRLKEHARAQCTKEYEELEKNVNRYKTIEEAIRITHYTELPIQK